jgi:hypothetical protein
MMRWIISFYITKAWNHKHLMNDEMRMRGLSLLPSPYPNLSCTQLQQNWCTQSHNKQYRIQNTETHTQKITYVPVLYGTWNFFLLRENPLLRPLEGVGHENLNFLGPKWHLLRSLPFQGPKKSWFWGPTPSNGPQNGFSRMKIITSHAI